jgi:hypothetical protein
MKRDAAVKTAVTHVCTHDPGAGLPSATFCQLCLHPCRRPSGRGGKERTPEHPNDSLETKWLHLLVGGRPPGRRPPGSRRHRKHSIPANVPAPAQRSAYFLQFWSRALPSPHTAAASLETGYLTTGQRSSGMQTLAAQRLSGRRFCTTIGGAISGPTIRTSHTGAGIRAICLAPGAAIPAVSSRPLTTLSFRLNTILATRDSAVRRRAGPAARAPF